MTSPATGTAAAIASATAFSDAYDADLLSQARAIAAAHTTEDMRAWLASKGDNYASTDAATIQAAFLGRAKAVLAETATMAARNAGHRAELATADRATMGRARALAAGAGETELRAWFRSQDRPTIAASDTTFLYGAGFGTAQGLINELLAIIDGSSARPAAAAAVQLAMFAKPDPYGTPDMFDADAADLADAIANGIEDQ
jgi:hypothetical protein